MIGLVIFCCCQGNKIKTNKKHTHTHTLPTCFCSTAPCASSASPHLKKKSCCPCLTSFFVCFHSARSVNTSSETPFLIKFIFFRKKKNKKIIIIIIIIIGRKDCFHNRGNGMDHDDNNDNNFKIK